MKHAVLGAGGVGGLIGAILANASEDVMLILRQETVAGYPSQLRLDGPSVSIAGPVRTSMKLEDAVDVLWITVKNTQLEEALPSIAITRSSIGGVVPLLNGIDHFAPRKNGLTGTDVLTDFFDVAFRRIPITPDFNPNMSSFGTAC